MRQPKRQTRLSEVFQRMESAGLSDDVQVIRAELRRLRLNERDRRIVARHLTNALGAALSASQPRGGTV